jgi:hypothetical protein
MEILRAEIEQSKIDRTKDDLFIIDYKGFTFFDQHLTTKKRHYWIWGASNTGKTTFVIPKVSEHINVSILSVGGDRVNSESDPLAPILLIDDPGSLHFGLFKSLTRDESRVDVKFDKGWRGTKGRILIVTANLPPHLFFNEKTFEQDVFDNGVFTIEFKEVHKVQTTLAERKRIQL